MIRFFATAGAVFAFLAVALGAFGAHSLKRHFQEFPDLLPIYNTAAQYQMYHALGLFIVAWVATRWPGPLVHGAGYLLILGILLFCGSLYVLSLTNMRSWGAITPIGGLAFLAGWACLLTGIWKHN